MHELSIAYDLLNKCEEIAAKHQAKAITSIEITIGLFSGVEAWQLKRTFDVVKLESICKEAELKLSTSDGDEMILMRVEML